MTAIPLGLPEVPVRPIAERRVSRRIQVGPVAVGGGAPVSVQSMTTTRTSDIGATLQQIAELTASGCQIVRVACPTQDDADALPVIARALAESALWEASLFEEHDFRDIKISVKHNDPVVMVEAYRQSAPPVEEIKVGIQILQSLGLRERRLEIVSCPSCGRAQVDVYKLAEEVTAGLEGMEVPLRVAVMGCVVNWRTSGDHAT